MPHWKGLRYGEDESRGLSCGCTSSICQNVLKSDSLLHKWGFVDSQSVTTAPHQQNSIVFSENQVHLINKQCLAKQITQLHNISP